MELPNYGYTMIREDLAICPIVLREGERVLGLQGNELMVSNGHVERTIVIPFSDQGVCSVHTFTVESPSGEFEVVSLIVPDERGNRVMHVSVDSDRGMTFAVAEIRPPEPG